MDPTDAIRPRSWRRRLAALAPLLVPLLGACGGDDPPDPVAAEVVDYAFRPEVLEVDVGTEVTWTNGDDFAHTTTADSDAWRSGDVAPGGSYSFTFDEPGVYPYHCSIHNFMTGEVRVG